MVGDRTTLTPDGRIESWRAIAAFLGRDERTVQRWEKQWSLPVHRSPGERSSVFAYRQELFCWMQSPDTPPSARLSSVGLALPEAERLRSPDRPTAARPAVEEQASSAAPRERFRGRWLFWVAATAFAGFLFLADTYHAGHAADTAPLSSRGSPIFAPATSVQSSAPLAAAASVQAQEFYLRGRYYWSRRTGESLKQALDNFTEAIVLDPSYAQAYAGLAATYEVMPQYSAVPLPDAFPRAVAAAQRAVLLDPSSAEAHRVLGFALFYGEWKVTAATAELQRAMQIDPRDAEAHHWYATVLFTLRRSAEARAEIHKARELDPGSRSILADQLMIESLDGNAAASLEQLRELDKAEPDFTAPARYIDSVLFTKGEYGEWIAQLKKTGERFHSPREIALAQAADRGLNRSGERAMFVELRRAQQTIFDAGESSGFDLAETCIRLGDRDAAVHYLQAALRAHDFRLLSLFRDPIDRNFHGYPPYEQIRQAINAQMNAPA